jgi:hypothetical protein
MTKRKNSVAYIPGLKTRGFTPLVRKLKELRFAIVNGAEFLK